MAQTHVNIDAATGGIANPSEVPVVQGDTFTITASGGPAILFFSHDCHSAMSPASASRLILNEGDTADFEFTSSTPGNYVVVIADDPSQAPDFPPQKSANLTFTTIYSTILVGSGAGPTNQLQGN